MASSTTTGSHSTPAQPHRRKGLRPAHKLCRITSMVQKMSEVSSVFAVLVLFAGSEAAFCAAAQSDDAVTVDQVVAQAQAGINRARERLRAELSTDDQRQVPPLKSVTLTLSAEYVKNAKGNINAWVVSVNGGKSSQESTEVTLVLTPPPGSISTETAAKPLDETLADAIVDVVKPALAAAKRKPPLSIQSFKVGIKFVVERNIGGGIAVKLIPVGAGVDLSRDSKTTHNLTLEFEEPPKAAVAKAVVARKGS